MKSLKIAVLLSTYNGEKFLKEQLDSILAQTYENFILYIRDDGSTDGTKSILQDYQQKDSRIELEFGENLGYSQSFFSMLRTVEADLYAFCDQDDVWMANKLEVAQSAFQDEKKPTLWFSNIEICDAQMNHIADGKKDRFYSFEHSLFTNVATGMSMVINAAARNLIVSHDFSEIKIHDFWAYRVCAAFGEVLYDPQPLVRYRRHGSNASDYSYNNLQRYILGLKRVFFTDIYKDTKKELIIFQTSYGNELSPEKKQTIDLFANYKLNLLVRLRKVFFGKRLKDNWVNELIIRFLLLIGVI